MKKIPTSKSLSISLARWIGSSMYSRISSKLDSSGWIAGAFSGSDPKLPVSTWVTLVVYTTVDCSTLRVVSWKDGGDVDEGTGEPNSDEVDNRCCMARLVMGLAEVAAESGGLETSEDLICRETVVAMPPVVFRARRWGISISGDALEDACGEVSSEEEELDKTISFSLFTSLSDCGSTCFDRKFSVRCLRGGPWLWGIRACAGRVGVALCSLFASRTEWEAASARRGVKRS